MASSWTVQVALIDEEYLEHWRWEEANNEEYQKKALEGRNWERQTEEVGQTREQKIEVHQRPQ